MDQEFTVPLRRVFSLLAAVVVELAAGPRPLSEFEFADSNIYYVAGTPPRERLVLPVGELLPAGLHGDMFSLGRHCGLYNRRIFVSKKSIFELVTLIQAQPTEQRNSRAFVWVSMIGGNVPLCY